MAIRSFRRGPARPRRPMDWEYALVRMAGVLDGVKAAAQVVTSTELNAEYTDPTLMASRLVASARSTSVPASPGGAFAIGLIAWDDINNTVPASADLPGPITNGNLDWIIRWVAPVLAGQASGTVFSQGVELTSKARRRLGSSRTILCVGESFGISGDLVADCRVLIKE